MLYPKEILDELHKHNHIVTRFPPEPNGYLHIGHVKAIQIDFGLAEYANSLTDKTGECILRFDDTNPYNEKEHFTKIIEENISWLGYKPSKVTFTSDYFDDLYKLAIKLIKDGNAYVCNLTSDEIKSYRKEKKESPYKERSVEENLKLFTEMKEGKYEEGTLSLRMKGDLDNPNPCMWDTVFYRILKTSHPRTGNKWVIYPSYDFSHCIVDSLEGITHSLCSKEFEVRRESYYWLLDALKLRKPLVYEFSRFNVDGLNLSKRHIKKLIEEGKVESWEDPSLPTICGLRNRGFTASSLLNFCKLSGITKTDSSLDIHKLFNCVSNELKDTVKRKVVIMDPLEVEIVGHSDVPIGEKMSKFYDYPMYMGRIKKGEKIDAKLSGFRSYLMTKNIYINRSDFREVDSKKYYGLAPGKTIRLRYNEFYSCVRYDKDSKTGEITKVYIKRVTSEKPKKVRGIILWLPKKSIPIKINMYENGVYEKKTINAMAEMGLMVCSAKNVERYQFEKVGYFKRNYHSNEFEMIMDLKSSYK